MSTRIYVACLAAYNSGYLHGQWLDADQDLNALEAAVQRMLKSSPIANAEEHAIHDYEGFGPVSISEYCPLKSVCEIAAFIREYPDYGAGLISHFCGDFEEARGAVVNYCASYDSLAEFAAAITELSTEVPKNLEPYIDYERMARDMELNSTIFTIVNGSNVHVFWGR